MVGTCCQVTKRRAAVGVGMWWGCKENPGVHVNSRRTIPLATSDLRAGQGTGVAVVGACCEVAKSGVALGWGMVWGSYRAQAVWACSRAPVAAGAVSGPSKHHADEV